MKISELLAQLEMRYPPKYAESWDNVGLLVGDATREISKIYLTLDVTNEAVKQAVCSGAQLILSHHPMIFSSMKRVNVYDFIGAKIVKLLEHGMCCYAIHTNFDVLRMAEINGGLLQLQEQKVLYPTGEDESGDAVGIGRIGILPQEMTLEECAQYVKQKYGLPDVKVFGNLERKVTKAAVSGGSGKSMVDASVAANSEVLITGDIDHHTGIDAVDRGLMVIDAGHYGTEYFFIEQMKHELEEIAPQLEVVCAKVKHPFTTV